MMEMTTKERLALPQQEMPSQDRIERRSNMEEVALGYSREQAVLEAQRCLDCKNAPCIKGCPVGINIPAFLKETMCGRFDEALGIIRESSMLPAICGRVCPQEKQCMAACTVGKVQKDPMKSVAIGRVERFLADWGADKPIKNEVVPKLNKRVAIVGGGPSGLTCAADLNRLGYDVTIFEAFHKAGGVTVYGIPEFRLPKSIVEREIAQLEEKGVKIVTDFLVGRTASIKQLMEEEGFHSVYIASGAGLPRFMNIEGENLVGVFSANEFLTRANLMKAYEKGKAATPLYPSRRVVVLGGGNVAMDAARTALRCGAEEVRILYRRTEKELPARAEEVEHAMEEGIIFDFLTNPVRIMGDEKGRVTAVECLKYELGEPDESGRARPIALEGSEFLIQADTVIPALGNGSNPLIGATTEGLDFSPRGQILVDEQGMTSLPGVFAGGDIVQGAATVILAMGDGRQGAAGIHNYLKDKS
ncbi:MAG: NADPH-dependent glutamate synthase [Spirochaetales bacterium]|nr:NADPH-dependent glutamate synthase [Spirochaetales bacterium]